MWLFEVVELISTTATTYLGRSNSKQDTRAFDRLLSDSRHSSLSFLNSIHIQMPCLGQRVTDFNFNLRFSYLHTWKSLILVESLAGIVFRAVGRQTTFVSSAPLRLLRSSCWVSISIFSANIDSDSILPSKWWSFQFILPFTISYMEYINRSRQNRLATIKIRLSTCCYQHRVPDMLLLSIDSKLAVVKVGYQYTCRCQNKLKLLSNKNHFIILKIE